MRELEIAVVGAGALAETFYLPALKALGTDFGTLAVVEVNDARREKIASDFGLKPFASLQQAAKYGIKAAIVAVPNRFHNPVAIEAMRLGMDILVEKPLAQSSVEAQEMIQTATETGRILAVNQTRRLFATSAFVRDAVLNGSYGALKSVRYEEGAQFNWASVDGAYTRSDLSRTGVIADLGSHVVDVIAWWVGGDLTLKRCRHDGLHGPEAFAHIELEGVAEASVKLSRLGRMNNIFDVQFEKARLFGDIYNWTSINIEQKGIVTRKVLDTDAKVYSDMADVLLVDFARAVTTQSAPLFPAALSLPGMRLIDDCYDKAEKFEHSWYQRIAKGGKA